MGSDIRSGFRCVGFDWVQMEKLLVVMDNWLVWLQFKSVDEWCSAARFEDEIGLYQRKRDRW